MMSSIAASTERRRNDSPERAAGDFHRCNLPALEAASRVLLLTRNLPPLRGGMERLNHRLALALHSAHALSVAGPRGCSEHLPVAPERITESRHRPLPVFLLGCALGSLRIARRFRPDLVIAGSGLTAPLAWIISRCTGARSVVYLHGLDVVAPSVVYRRVWVPLIRRMELVLVNSRNTARLAEGVGIPASRIRILHPGTDLPGRNLAEARAFRERHGFGERPLLLTVGRLTPRKGVAEFVKHALPVILEKHPDALLIVIGDEAHDAISRRRGSQLGKIKGCATAAGVTGALRFLPPCDDATLSAAYSAADVHVFPLRELPGDVEGFGMVAIEAAAHGLPTVAFAAGGIADAVVEGETGELVPAGDYAALARAVQERLMRRGDAVARLACIDSIRDFAWDRFEQRLRMLLAESLTVSERA